MNMPFTSYRQRDPMWGALTLGYNADGHGFDLSNYGCLLTIIAGAAGMTPAQANDAGKARGLFAAGSGNALTFDPVRWKEDAQWGLLSASPRYPSNPFPAKYYREATAHVKAGSLAFLELQWPRTRGQHFVAVIAVAERPGGDVMVISDPERAGEVETLDRFYGQWAEAIVRTVLLTSRPFIQRDGVASRSEGKTVKYKPVGKENPHQTQTQNL